MNRIGAVGALAMSFGLSGFADSSIEVGPEFEISGKLMNRQLELRVKPPSLYHFNLKAPVHLSQSGQVKAISPAQAGEQEIVFKISSPETARYQLALYLCDDSQTVCKKSVAIFDWDAKTAQLKRDRQTSLISRVDSQSSSANTPDPHGFILNDPEKAMAEAAQLKKPLIIDFFGIWCPPCNELDEEVFSSEEFRNHSTEFIKLKLDADQAISWSLKSKYRITGYPTVIFASSNGEEISRVVGYRDKKMFSKLIAEAWQNREKPLSQYLAQAEKGNRNALDRLGLMHLERQEYAEASKKLQGSVTYREQYFQALIGELSEKQIEKEPSSEVVLLLEKSLKEYPHTFASIERRFKLADFYLQLKRQDERKQTLTEMIPVVRKLLEKTDEELAKSDTSHADLWEITATVYENLGQMDQAKSAWKSALSEYQKKMKSGRERGYALETAYCLWKTGDFASADRLYEKFEKEYAHEFTFFFNHAMMKMSQKDFQRAEKLASDALKYSYGDNQLRASHLLANAMKMQGKKEDAKEVAQKYLRSAAAPSDPKIRTHRYLRQLEDLVKDLG